MHGEHSTEFIILQAREAMRAVVSNRAWIVATPILVESERTGTLLLELGAERVMAIGVNEGVRLEDQGPENPKLTCLCLDLNFEGDMMIGIRSGEGALDELSPEVLAQIDAFDPQQEAQVIRTIFNTSATFAGRKVFGARQPSWIALEDKVTIDQFWDQAGIKRAPSLITSLDEAALQQALLQIDQGSGVVIAGDNRSGWHGGASRTRWARTQDDLRLITRELSGECDQARVMPFLEGVSCSIHGWVSSGGELTSFRPCEMLIGIKENTYFEYLGAATNWKPSPEVYAEMRAVAARAAQYLHAQYGYLGSFTIDGIDTKEGFLPTELNPRFGGALGRMVASLPQLPLLIMHFATVEGYPLGVSLDQLSSLLVDAVEANPVIRGMRELSQACPAQIRVFIRWEDGEWRGQADEEGADAELNWGPALHGSLIFGTIKPHVIPHGQSCLHEVITLLDTAQFKIFNLDQ